MEELKQLELKLQHERPAPWDGMPDISLYMDQVISYLPRQLIHFDETDLLTSAMVNNYIKDGLLPRAEGKRYSRTHLAYLTAICALKQVLSVKEMKKLIRMGSEGRDPERLYSYFCGELDLTLNSVANDLASDLPREDLPRLALDLALRSYANKLACQRILSMLQTEEENAADKKRAKEKRD